MIDVPLGKALVPVGRDKETSCNDCCFVKKCEYSAFPINALAWHLTCEAKNRKDGKNVIFKLVDYPVEDKMTDEELIEATEFLYADRPDITSAENRMKYGMTLRDYFAGQALASRCAHHAQTDTNDIGEYIKKTAVAAYEIADAMLAEREKRNGEDNG